MINLIKIFFNNKSRFYFNLTFLEIIKKFFFYVKNYKTNYSNIFDNKLKFFFPNSNKFFFNHGRGGFFALLKYFKNRSRKKVLINSFTLFEMVNMIIYAGYEPIFVDNKKNDFATNTIELIEKHKKEISIVVVTHLNGFNNEIFKIKKKINEINENRHLEDKIFLVEDAAVSFGAKHKDIYCGSIGDFSILSFNIMKNITSLTGGALIDNLKIINFDQNENNPSYVSWIDILKKIFFVFMLQFLNSKLVFPFFFVFIKIAQKNNYKFFLRKYRTDFQTYLANKIPLDFLKGISNFQIFLLIDQLKNVEENNNIRIKNSLYIYEQLKNNEKLIFPQTLFNQENIFIEFPIICKNKEYKNFIFSKSFDKFVDIKDYYYKNCETEQIYSKYKGIDCSNAKFISENIMMLPVNINQNKKDLDKVISLFR